jgi:hypothetical protein
MKHRITSGVAALALALVSAPVQAAGLWLYEMKC